MDPLAPSAVSQADMIRAALERLIDEQSGRETLLILGVLLVAVLLLGVVAAAQCRGQQQSALHAPTRQQLARSLSKQESREATPADIRARAIGTLGEGLVTAEIEKAGWPMLRNVILDLSGRTAEIDLLVRLPDGIVALEVKTFSGFISGGEHDPYWTQHLPTGTHRLLNPVRQNSTHLRALQAFLCDNRVRVIGFVVMAGRARFASDIAHIPVPRDQLRRAISREIQSGLTDPAVSTAWSRLQTAASVSQQRREDHIRFVQSRKAARGQSTTPAMQPSIPTAR